MSLRCTAISGEFTDATTSDNLKMYSRGSCIPEIFKWLRIVVFFIYSMKISWKPYSDQRQLKDMFRDRSLSGNEQRL